jgi:hypothetical protein
MGNIIFSNATQLDSQWTPNGQDVHLTIDSTKVTLKPGERHAFEIRQAKNTVVAKPQLSKAGMKSGKQEFTVKSPSGGGTIYVWIAAKYTGQFKLGFYRATHAYTPPH